MPVTKMAGEKGGQPAADGAAQMADKAELTETTATVVGRSGAGMVAFVGAGPGDEGLLTLRAVALLGEADLVVASPEITARLAHLIRPGAATATSEAAAQDPKLLVKAARSGHLVVRLFAGDPFLFCHAATEAAACAKAKISVEVVPGVSSATSVPAYAGIPLT